MLTFKSRAAAGERVSEFYRALRIKVKGFFQKARRRNDLKLVNGYEELDLRTLSIFPRPYPFHLCPRLHIKFPRTFVCFPRCIYDAESQWSIPKELAGNVVTILFLMFGLWWLVLWRVPIMIIVILLAWVASCWDLTHYNISLAILLASDFIFPNNKLND